MPSCYQQALSALFIMFSGIHRLNYVADQEYGPDDILSWLVVYVHIVMNEAQI